MRNESFKKSVKFILSHIVEARHDNEHRRGSEVDLRSGDKSATYQINEVIVRGVNLRKIQYGNMSNALWHILPFFRFLQQIFLQ